MSARRDRAPYTDAETGAVRTSGRAIVARHGRRPDPERVLEAKRIAERSGVVGPLHRRLHGHDPSKGGRPTLTDVLALVALAVLNTCYPNHVAHVTQLFRWANELTDGERELLGLRDWPPLGEDRGYDRLRDKWKAINRALGEGFVDPATMTWCHLGWFNRAMCLAGAGESFAPTGAVAVDASFVAPFAAFPVRPPPRRPRPHEQARSGSARPPWPPASASTSSRWSRAPGWRATAPTSTAARSTPRTPRRPPATGRATATGPSGAGPGCHLHAAVNVRTAKFTGHRRPAALGEDVAPVVLDFELYGAGPGEPYAVEALFDRAVEAEGLTEVLADDGYAKYPEVHARAAAARIHLPWKPTKRVEHALSKAVGPMRSDGRLAVRLVEGQPHHPLTPAHLLEKKTIPLDSAGDKAVNESVRHHEELAAWRYVVDRYNADGSVVLKCPGCVGKIYSRQWKRSRGWRKRAKGRDPGRLPRRPGGRQRPLLRRTRHHLLRRHAQAAAVPPRHPRLATSRGPPVGRRGRLRRPVRQLRQDQARLVLHVRHHQPRDVARLRPLRGATASAWRTTA